MNSSSPISVPKVSIYHANGYGRDSYIYLNNGGFSKSINRLLMSNDGKFSPPQKLYDLR